jgi:hypothetical protein
MTVNFNNTLQAAFSYQSSLHTVYVLTIWACNFWQKDFGANTAHKMLVKLTPAGYFLILQHCNLFDQQLQILATSPPPPTSWTS